MTTFPEVVDSTILSAYKSCPTLAWLSYFEHWKPKELSVHLHAGASFAKGLEIARLNYFVDGASAEESVALGLQALLQHYGNFECPADSAKSAERTAGAMEFYFDAYPLGEDECTPIDLPGGKKGIEFSFVHPLPIQHPETGDPLLYCGRMDQLANFAGGVFIEDDKTTSSLGATWGRQWDLRAQFTGYKWGCRESGIKVDGVLVRGVSILKTKYGTEQAISYRPDWMVDLWLGETIDLVKNMIWDWERMKFAHNFDSACAAYGGCKFRQACQSQDKTPWLEDYFERRQWSPVTREEKLL